jgi:hypothetical protein
MAKDYTKYTIEGIGENFNKRQLVFDIIKDYTQKNNLSLEELSNVFPDHVQGSKGLIRKESEVNDAKRFNMKKPLIIKNGIRIVVSNQWGGDNIPSFIEVAEKLGYKITSVNIENDYDQTTVEEFMNLIHFNLETPFPKGVEIIEISVANCESKLFQDLGERIVIHYDVNRNRIVKHVDHFEVNPVYEYLDVWEAEIPETYFDLKQWMGQIYFSGKINGKDWNVSYHAGYIEDRVNIDEEMERILFQNFNEINMFHFMQEVLQLFK